MDFKTFKAFFKTASQKLFPGRRRKNPKSEVYDIQQ